LGHCSTLAALRVPPALVGRAHEAGLRVTIWTMDDPGKWDRFAAMGVDAICTNCPHLMPRGNSRRRP